MLKSMSMLNFIHFRDRQELKFEEGVNFIIGASSTGKTACFELLRRCLSDEINKTTSSISNKSELAYVVCHFQISENFPDKDVEHVIACLFVEHDHQSSTTNNCIVYKVLCSRDKNRTSKVHIKKSLGRHGCDTKELEKASYHELQLKSTSPRDPVGNIIAGKYNEMDLFNDIRDATNSMDFNVLNSTKMDDIYKWLEDRYVGLMPLRSIGPIQWTKSSNLQSDENYRIASDRAEILNALLCSEKLDRELEDMYHQNLTFPFEFTKTEKGIYVKNTEKDTDLFPLLKCPEGIVEAKQLSLILSHKEFSTITLEEPDRGMHPHMIKKMRDLILRSIMGKTVLIITHNPCIVNQWSMSRSFICSKIIDCDKISHNIRKVPEKGWKKYGRNEEMQRLLFSPRVFFVEGPTDKLVFEAVFSYLTIKSKLIKQEVVEFLLSTEVVELQSATHGREKMKFCQKLMKETFVLYDFDIFKNEFKPTIEGGVRVCGEKAQVKFDEEYNNLEDFRQKGFTKFEEKCEDANVFCWKEGALENQIISIRSELDGEVSEQILGNTKDKTATKKYIKKNLLKAKSTDLDILAATLVQHCKEMTRFIRFLEKMAGIKMPAISGKRKTPKPENPVKVQYKRQKSKDTANHMSVDITKASTSSQSTELLHSGVSDCIEDLDLDEADSN